MSSNEGSDIRQRQKCCEQSCHSWHPGPWYFEGLHGIQVFLCLCGYIVPGKGQDIRLVDTVSLRPHNMPASILNRSDARLF